MPCYAREQSRNRKTSNQAKTSNIIKPIKTSNNDENFKSNQIRQTQIEVHEPRRRTQVQENFNTSQTTQQPSSGKHQQFKASETSIETQKGEHEPRNPKKPEGQPSNKLMEASTDQNSREHRENSTSKNEKKIQQSEVKRLTETSPELRRRSPSLSLKTRSQRRIAIKMCRVMKRRVKAQV